MKLLFPKQNYNVLSPSSYTHISVRDLYTYFQDRSAYSAAGKYVDRSWEYINRSQTHECGNWGRAIPRKGIHKWDFPCNVCTLADPSLKYCSGCGIFPLFPISVQNICRRYWWCVMSGGAGHHFSNTQPGAFVYLTIFIHFPIYICLLHYHAYLQIAELLQILKKNFLWPHLITF